LSRPRIKESSELGRAPAIQSVLEKQLEFLVHDLRHPSHRAKKYGEAIEIWQARVTGAWRFYFRIGGDTYQLLTITRHSK
jgi:hypothetical protein